MTRDEQEPPPKLPAKFAAEPMPRAQLSDAIRDEVHRDLAPVRALTRSARVAWSMLLLAAIVIAYAALKVGDGVHGVTRGAAFGTIGWAIVVIGVLMSGLGRFGARTRWLQMGMACVVPFGFLGYLALLSNEWVPWPEFIAHETHTQSAFACGSVAVGFGVLATASVLFIWRRTDPFNPGWSGALLGLVGGLGGAASVGLVCPWREGWHLWLGHGAGVLVLCALGAWLGRRSMTP